MKTTSNENIRSDSASNGGINPWKGVRRGFPAACFPSGYFNGASLEGIEMDEKAHVELVRVHPSERLTQFIRRESDALYRRYPGLDRLRRSIKRDSLGAPKDEFIATARLEVRGHDRVVEKRGSGVFSAISRSLEVCDRQMRRRARMEKSKTRVQEGHY